ncbi:hypothetical protein [Pontibacter chinhatensis]|uniref:Outer membrane protein beta-barrel domain-containing protein n=1 Tax=Pontibacter chinhatensis TaxID=1436961 RepID=A0A1I2RAD1_9BACT|nr:hypothetical protein [Pontibacter chinhatensis]SFG37003.1 hypothetical protein SAMN05421739_102307 [Pontibacter chinhatensis]
MRKINLTCFLILVIATYAKAQVEAAAKYNKAIFVEVLGNGLGITANYDMRLTKGEQGGFGFRAGVGGLALGTADSDGTSTTSSLVTFPLTLNYLAGQRRSAFEAGIGLTPVYASMAVQKTNNPGVTKVDGWGATGFINMGYRYQPLNDGLVFRFDWTPAFNSAGFSPAWFGMSVGYGFK